MLTEHDLNDFGTRIRQRRMALGLTLTDLAFILQLKRNNVRNREKGMLPRDLDELIKLVRWLKNEEENHSRTQSS